MSCCTKVRRLRLSLGLVAFLVLATCTQPPEARLSGSVSGRVLIAPGVGLANATVIIEQIELYQGASVRPGEIRRHHLDVTTDANGFFGPVSAGAYAGVFRLRTQGGEYRDPISDAKVRFDPAQELRALHFMDFFGTRDDMNVTPVHTIAEARFRYLVSTGEAPLRAIDQAYSDVRQHFGDLDWQHVTPAEVDGSAVSPTDAYRAAFLLGGWAVLADDFRLASGSTPQVVNVMTLTQAAAQDLAADLVFDGNDGNDLRASSGLQVGLCDPLPPTCQAPPNGCQLGACRTRCDVYANTFRAGLAAGVRKFMGSKSVPSTWNRTTLGSEDVRSMLAHLAQNAVPELFGTACTETSDRVEPTIVWEIGPADQQPIKGVVTLRVRAIDDAETPPSVQVVGKVDEDGDPTNATAIVTLDTRLLNGGADGNLPVEVLAKDLAGNERRSARTFRIDNTAPVVALDDSDFYVAPSGVRWTAAPAPTIRGFLSEAQVDTVEIVVGGTIATSATVAPGGMSWTAQIPEGRITSSGNEVFIRAKDTAGNVTSTAPVQARLDATPPSVLMEQSLVYDERLSREIYEDDAANNVWVQRHLVQGTPVDLSQSMPGTCVTLGKYSHLLSTSLPLGAAGALNPLRMSAVVSDDGVGIAQDSTKMRVSVNGTEVLAWTAVDGTPIAPQAKRHELGLYRDGTLPLPALATTEGTYLVELRSVDHLGRVSVQTRCWNHKVLAPKVKLTPGAEVGSIAAGFPQALYSTSLGMAGPFGDVSSKLLNASPQGASVWQWRVKNYVAAPIYVTMNIAKTDVAVTRKFTVKETFVDTEPTYTSCGPPPPRGPPPQCSIAQLTPSYVGEEPIPEHKDAKFRGRLFLGSGAGIGAEILPCAGCTNDDIAQVYTFEIPARTAPQGSPLPEYVFVTHLRTDTPGTGGAPPLSAKLAPSNVDRFDAGPFGEFIMGGTLLTGKLVTPPSSLPFCTTQQFDTEFGEWFCTQRARTQTYRALTSLRLEWTRAVNSTYLGSAAPTLSGSTIITGTINANDMIWTTSISSLP